MKSLYDCRRDYDFDRMLDAMTRRGEPLPESHPVTAEPADDARDPEA